MTSTPPLLVTFLVPCFNYARYLRACIDSIRGQTYQHVEIIILDDASTDETPDLAAQLTAEDARIRYVRHPQNIGHLNNYNVGIELAQGELIWLISADDCLASDTVLETFVDQFARNPRLGYAFCRVQCIDEHSVPYDKFIPAPGGLLPTQAQVFDGRTLFKKLLHGNFVPAPSTIARKACYLQYGLFHPALTHSGDWYNWLLFSLDWDVYFNPEALVYYRKHQQNMHLTYQKPRHALENSLLCHTALEQYLQAHHYPPDLQRVARLARLRFMKKNDFPLGWVQRLELLGGKLTAGLTAG